MDCDDTEFRPGQRIRLSALGKARSPRVKVHTGIIVGEPWVVACASYWMAARRR
jgi:hypothetical protein